MNVRSSDGTTIAYERSGSGRGSGVAEHAGSIPRPLDRLMRERQ